MDSAHLLRFACFYRTASRGWNNGYRLYIRSVSFLVLATRRYNSFLVLAAPPEKRVPVPGVYKPGCFVLVGTT
jgi:hypothetical protein